MQKGNFRHYGIDLFRLVAMMMVVLLHVLLHGGALENAIGVQKEVLRFMQALAICSVNCYVLISGYVGVNSKQKWANLGFLWLQVLIYSAGIMGLGWLLFPQKVTNNMLFCSVFPVMTKQYWFFTAYVGMFILAPLCNHAVRGMAKQELQRLIVVALMAFSVMSLWFKTDVFLINGGFGVLWFLVVYLVGAYIKQYGLFEKWSVYVWLLVYVGASMLTWGVQIIAVRIDESSLWPGLILSYSSPTVLLAAVALLKLFSCIQIKGKASKVIGFLSASAFGVYLIHEHDLIRAVFIQDRFSFVVKYSIPIMVLLVLVAVALIFIVCLGIDLIRNQMFKWLKIKKLLVMLEEKLTLAKV